MLLHRWGVTDGAGGGHLLPVSPGTGWACVPVRLQCCAGRRLLLCRPGGSVCGFQVPRHPGARFDTHASVCCLLVA